jgi:acetylornithine deacetylase/succinyl-diaminopimelate desuccinylase-like protein
LQVKDELKEALAPLGLELEIDMYASKMGYEAKGVEPVIDVIETTYQSLFNKKTPAPTGVHASIWTDTNIYNEMGIPACKFGLGGGKDPPFPRSFGSAIERLERLERVRPHFKLLNP